ncbi:ester cyclase [Streptomyces sp. NBC_00390]|uniref:ester cyclase n=1 Tax=Streptomyces sp. NBC_00390 TaxID=2975736 RepID=UPI002E21880A
MAEQSLHANHGNHRSPADGTRDVNHGPYGTQVPDGRDLKALAADLSDEVWNHARLDVVDEFFAPDFHGHMPVIPDVHGPEEFKQLSRDLRAGLPDLREQVQSVLGEGDRVFIRSILTGTHLGEMMDLPPTGTPIRMNQTFIYRFERGKVVELWQQIDYLGVMRQLGVVPPQGASQLGRIAHTFKLMGRFAVLQIKAARSKERTTA